MDLRGAPLVTQYPGEVDHAAIAATQLVETFQGSDDSRRITYRAGDRCELIVGELFHGVLDAVVVGQFRGRDRGVLLVLLLGDLPFPMFNVSVGK